MQNEIEMLRSIRQSTEMGCSGIRAVLPEAQNPAMQSALRSQWKNMTASTPRRTACCASAACA